MIPKSIVINPDLYAAKKQVENMVGYTVAMFVDSNWSAHPTCGGMDLFALYSNWADEPIGLNEGIGTLDEGVVAIYYIPERKAAAFVEFLHAILVPTPDGGFVAPMVVKPGEMQPFAARSESFKKLAGVAHWIHPYDFAPDDPLTVQKKLQLRAAGINYTTAPVCPQRPSSN